MIRVRRGVIRQTVGARKGAPLAGFVVLLKVRGLDRIFHYFFSGCAAFSDRGSGKDIHDSKNADAASVSLVA